MSVIGLRMYSTNNQSIPDKACKVLRRRKYPVSINFENASRFLIVLSSLVPLNYKENMK